jgi:SAM-dependent methyltransferase
MVYQTIGDTPGDSDSAAKWDALRIKPETLEGAAVLDVGCNAGFFCEAAAEAGATRVVGIDRNAGLIQQAKARQQTDAVVKYHRQSWAGPILAGPWDVVLMLSAIHYERDQVGLLRRLGDVLAPGGVLVLECGVAPATGDTWQRCTRPGNSTVRFPSMVCLTRTIGEAGLVGRYVGRSVDQNGDAIPRHVFHCHKRRRELLLVSGRGRAGKSTLCAGLVGPVFSVDEFTRQNVTTEHAPWTEHARDVGTDRLQPLFESLAERPELLAGFVASLFDCVPDVPTLVVDCHELLTASIQDAATARGFKVWTATTGGV